MYIDLNLRSPIDNSNFYYWRSYPIEIKVSYRILYHQQNQIQPMLWMILIFKYFSSLFCSLSTSDGSDLGLFSVLSTEGNKGTVSLLVSIKLGTMTSSTALDVFGSVDKTSNIVSAADQSICSCSESFSMGKSFCW